jgi:hypothetical protein
MYMRDKNGEHASQRIARKVFDREQVKECNTRTIRNGLPLYISTDILLHNTKIAEVWECGKTGKRKLYVMNGHQFDGTRLTKARKHELVKRANKLDVEVINVYL